MMVTRCKSAPADIPRERLNVADRRQVDIGDYNGRRRRRRKATCCRELALKTRAKGIDSAGHFHANSKVAQPTGCQAGLSTFTGLRVLPFTQYVLATDCKNTTASRTHPTTTSSHTGSRKR
jgi:hypothetical protein